jgi:hypothetical protein
VIGVDVTELAGAKKWTCDGGFGAPAAASALGAAARLLAYWSKFYETVLAKI